MKFLKNNPRGEVVEPKIEAKEGEEVEKNEEIKKQIDKHLKYRKKKNLPRVDKRTLKVSFEIEAHQRLEKFVFDLKLA